MISAWEVHDWYGDSEFRSLTSMTETLGMEIRNGFCGLQGHMTGKPGFHSALSVMGYLVSRRSKEWKD